MPIFKRKDAKPRQPKTKISAPMPVADPNFSNFKSSQENLAVPGKNDQSLTRVQSNSLSRPQPKYAPKIADVATKFGGIKLSGSDIASVEEGTGGIEKSASMSQLVSPTNTVPPNTSPQHSNVVLRNAVSRGSTASPTRFSMISDTSFALNGHDEFRVDLGKEKSYSTLDLQLPELEVDDGLRERYVHVMKGPTGGFGFELRVSYMPDPLMPEASRPVHVLDPKTNCVASLMSGDILIEVNSVNVEFEPHERVVELIRAAGDEMDFIVRSAPDLVELNIRGALTNSPELSSSPRKIWSTQKSRTRLLKGVGTLRRAGKGGTKKKVLQKHEVDPTEDRVWLVHKEGFSLGVVVPENLGGKRGSELSRQTSLVRGSRESYKVKLQSGKVLEVDEEDVEKANPRHYDRVEDLTELLHLNESSVLHVLRQRYGASLVHTFAGRHLIVINPMRQLASSYSDKVMEMFRGCRREDMPPHIFAAAQQAYHSMLSSRSDQSLVLMGVSGSGKTFNTRFLLKYLGSFADGTGTITYEKLKAIDVLLLSFANAATLLNPRATRVTLLYSMEFDPSGNLLGMTIRTFLLEKNRAAERPSREKNFEIFYNMLSGANDQFRSDLLLNAPVSPEETNAYVEHENLEEDDETTATQLQAKLAARGCYVSLTTILRNRRQLGWVYRGSAYCQLIRNENKQKRLEWARANLDNNFDDVIWSDESSIQLDCHKRYCCRKEGEKPRPKHPTKVHVWAGISKKGATGICIFEGTMDATLYCEILRRTFLPFLQEKFPDSHKFMQDNDPKHCSRMAQNFYSEVGINWWRTPPESPDLNPIENLWHEMKDYLRRNIKPKNKQELVDGITTFWATVTEHKCTKYIEHLKKVIPRVIEQGGGPTGY